MQSFNVTLLILAVNMPDKIDWYVNYCCTKLHFSGCLLQIVLLKIFLLNRIHPNVCVLGGGGDLKLYYFFIAFIFLFENPFLSLTLLYNPSAQVMSVEKGSHYILSSEQYAVIRRLGTLSKENRIPISCWFLEKRMSRLISLVNNEKNLQYKYCEMFGTYLPLCLWKIEWLSVSYDWGLKD